MKLPLNTDLTNKVLLSLAQAVCFAACLQKRWLLPEQR